MNKGALTFVDVLHDRARLSPQQTAFTFLEDGEQASHTVSYLALHEQALAVAAALKLNGANRGDRALLVFPPGLDFVGAFFGCLYAGVIAVPSYPPDPARLDRTLPRLLAIAKASQPRIVLTTALVRGIASTLPAPELSQSTWLAIEDAQPAASDAFSPSPSDVAFLQYTSGSTAAPKGVIISHENLMRNSAHIAESSRNDPETRSLTWLPTYHDMGLIDGVLQPIWSGFHCHMMPPNAFLQRPARWLEAITRYRITASGGPNFAYAMCTKKVTEAEREHLDLASWRVAYNGAEPVRWQTIEQFAHRFAAQGFRREAMAPVYGMAEATVMVASTKREAGARACFVDKQTMERTGTVKPGSDPVVSCGAVKSDIDARIVDLATYLPVGDDRVGELWLRGASLSRGYFGDPDRTKQAFGARHEGQSDGGSYYRTGDLAFVRDGELYVTGRLKDMLIVRGRNIIPSDIEASAETAHEALRAGCAVAFSVTVDGSEAVALAMEVDPRLAAQPADIVEQVRHAVAWKHEVAVAAVALLKPRTLPKTSSGKVRRQATKEAFFAERLDAIYIDRVAALRGPWEPPIQAWVCEGPSRFTQGQLQQGLERVLRKWPTLARVWYPNPTDTFTPGIGSEAFACLRAQDEDLDKLVKQAAFARLSSAVELGIRVRLLETSTRQVLVISLPHATLDAAGARSVLSELLSANLRDDAHQPRVDTLTLPASEARVALPMRTSGLASDSLESERFTLTVAQTEALAALTNQHSVSLSSWVGACYAVWLSRLAGQTRFMMATPRPDTVPWCALSVEVQAQHALLDLVRQSGERMTLKATSVRSGEGCNVAMMEQPVLHLDRRVLVPLLPIKSPFDLTLAFGLYGGRLAGSLLFRASDVPPATRSAWAEGFAEILSSSLVNHDKAIAELSWMSTKMATSLWALTTQLDGEETRQPRTVLAAFAAATAASAPLRSGEQTVTRAQLAHRANRIAHILAQRGVSKGEVVALHGELGLSFVTAVLGIWKAGGVVQAIEHTFPEAHTKRIAGERRFMIHTRDIEPLLATETTSEAFVSHVSPHDAAYLVHTAYEDSDPHPLLLTHAALAQGAQTWLSLLTGAERDVLSVRAPAWSTHVMLEVAAALSTTLPVYIATAAEQRCAAAFGARCFENEVSAYATDPAQIRVFLAAMLDGDARFKHFRRFVIRSGESTPEVLSKLSARAPAATITSVYGLAECGGPVMRAETFGRYVALPHAVVRVLDAQGRLVPVGVYGELCVGTQHLAQGIPNHRVVEDPLTSGTFLFRSGDRARLHQNGSIELQGRWDSQEKVLGYRTTRSAVERLLRTRPEVGEAFVTSFTTAFGDVRLAAYVVAAPGASTHDPTLLQFLREQLPEPCAPGSCQTIAALPLTPEGRIDRNQLPSPSWLLTRQLRHAEPPATETERKLAAIWSEVLGVRAIGRDQSFLSLGGDSFLGLQMMSEAQRQGLQVTPALLSRCETVRALAAELDQL